MTNWRIKNRHDGTFVDAEGVEFSNWTYHGEMNDDFQPNGIGAMYIDGQYIRGGYWINGHIADEDKLSKEEYDKRVNEIVNKK